MRVIIYILLVFGLFASCKSDDMESLQSDKISTIEIIKVQNLGGLVNTGASSVIDLEYDAMGRLKKIGDREFYYGANGRVEFSRIERKVKDPYKEEVYVEHLSYHWDAQGRLKDVYVDSLYQNYNYSIGSDLQQNRGSLIKDGLLAQFSYEGQQTKPSVIRYRTLSLDPSSLLVGLGQEREAKYFYDGANVINSQQNLDISVPISTAGGISYTPHDVVIVELFTYLTNTNYLAKMYDQLGFHPFMLHEVVSANSIATRTVEADMKGLDISDNQWRPSEGGGIHWTDVGNDLQDMSLFFDGKTTYSYRFNVLELPTEILAEGFGTSQRTIITYE